MSPSWYGTNRIQRRGWVCGYCGKDVGGNVGYHDGSVADGDDSSQQIYICPRCERPTAFALIDGEVVQVPGAPYGVGVSHVPKDVDAVYSEARRCIQSTAYTAAVLALRKLLMHVAVDKGAEPNRKFVEYVDFLDNEHYIPPNGREWVDAMRSMGNDATHEIIVMGESDAKRMLDFAEMLLKIAYEFPARVHETS